MGFLGVESLIRNTTLKYICASLIVIVIFSSVVILLVDPIGFNIKPFASPLVAALFIAAPGFSYRLASTNPHRWVVGVGTVLLAALFAFVAFGVVAAAAWFFAVAHT